MGKTLSLNVDINATSHDVHEKWGSDGKSVRGAMDLNRGIVLPISEY